METKHEIVKILRENGIELNFVPELVGQLDGLINQVLSDAIKNAIPVIKSGLFTPENLKSGCSCPACSQFIKMYKRKIDKSMAHIMLRLYKVTAEKPEQEFFHIDEDLHIPVTSSGIAKLRYWNLVEEKASDPNLKDKKSSGMWRITNKGKLFVQGKVTVPKYAKVYNKVVHGFEGEEVNIQMALGSKFNYEELMTETV